MSGGEDAGSPPPVKKKKLWFKRPTRPALVDKEKEKEKRKGKVEVDKATSTTMTTNTPDSSSLLQMSPPAVGKGRRKVNRAESTAAPPLVDDYDGGGGDEDAGKITSSRASAGRRKGSKDAASFFIRSENVYTAIVADEKKQLAKKKEDKKRKSEGQDKGSNGDREAEMEEVLDNDDDGDGDDRDGLHKKGKRKPRQPTSWKERKGDYEIISLDSDDGGGGRGLGEDEDEDECEDENSDSLGLYGDVLEDEAGISLRNRGGKGRKGRAKGVAGEDDIRIVKKPSPRKRSLTPPPQVYVPKVTATRSPSASVSTQARSRQTPTPSTVHAIPAPPQSTSQRKPGVPMTITLDSDSDDDNNTPIPASTSTDDLPPPPILPDLEARARALASPPLPTTANTSRLSAPPSIITATTNLDPTRSTTVLVTSPLPHTRPLLAKIRLNQKLRAVRQAWCRYQHTPEQIQAGVRIFEPEIFLTYKGRKVFDANTFLGIGAGNGEDDTSRIDWGVEGGGEDNRAGIIFTAVDEPTFQRMREEAANINSTTPNHTNLTSLSTSKSTNPTNPTNPPMSTASDIEIQPSHSGGRDDSDDEEEPSDGSLRLILRGKGMEEFKIKVKPETRISRIIGALVQQRERVRGEGKEVVLKWDGEEVDPEGRVGEMEWEDKDVVEVWMK